ncbi:MAG: hypothetical protein R3A80_03865 [Bdellovibrionota bacterium]
MKTSLFVFLALLTFSAHASDSILELKQADLNSQSKELTMVGNSLVVKLDARDIASNLNVEVVSEGMGTSCWYTAPVQKKVSKDWATYEVKIEWSPGGDSFEDHKCTILLKEESRYLYLKLKDFE